MPLILFWAEVEKEDENFVFSGLIKREEEESSLLSGMMKEEEMEEEKETSIFLGGDGKGGGKAE
jgi:hypothetical protein